MRRIKKKKMMLLCMVMALALLLLPAEVFAAKASIKLNRATASVTVGGQIKLTATVTGKTKTVTWKSSNPKVAAVNKNGKVTGKKAGKATITAQANGKTAKCVVTVKKPKVTITLNKKSASIYVGKAVRLTAAVTGSTQKVLWSSSNKAVATVGSKGKVTGIKPGSAVITAKVGSVTAKCTVTVKNTPKALYRKFLEKGKWKDGSYEVSLNYFCLLDIDQNGTPELVTSERNDPGRTQKYIFCIKNGKVSCCGSIGGWGLNYSSRYKAVCEVDGTPGTWETLFRLSQYKLKSFKYNACYALNYSPWWEYHFGTSSENNSIVNEAKYNEMEKKYFSDLKEYSLYFNTQANRDSLLK